MITLDATVGGAAANSYATIVQADALAETRVGAAAAAWFALDASGTSNDAKARALITATRDIDSIPTVEFDFVGEKASATQALEFPRNTDPASLPSRLVDATIELAFLYQAGAATADPLSLDVSDRKKVQSGDDSVEFFAPENMPAYALERFPAVVQRLLSSLIVALVFEGQWGSGTQVRTS